MRLPNSAIPLCVLLLLLSSCEQQPDKTTPPTDKADKTNSTATIKSDMPESLGHDFYSDTSNIDAHNTDKKPSVATVKNSDTDNDDTNPASSKSIIEGLEFASATKTFSKPSDSLTKSVCLVSDSATLGSLNTKALIEDACKKISTRLASVDYQSCLNAELKTSGCNSVKDFPILVREFTPVSTRQPLGRILVIGGTHGDELTSVSVSMRWIDQLRKNHSGLFHWRIAPLMNPDAVLKPSATRTNHNGVDLNRNMPSDDWDEKALKYWQQKSGEDVRKFPGNTPASEPETQWLIDEINYFKPDAIISVHAPYGVVDFDSLLLKTAPKSLGKLHLNLLGTYPGSLGNYAGINRNIPVITLELPHSWVMPSMQESNQIWQDIVLWLSDNVPAKGS